MLSIPLSDSKEYSQLIQVMTNNIKKLLRGETKKSGMADDGWR